nr:nitrogen fixation protein NifQ [uncultured Enterobacter sp.]
MGPHDWMYRIITLYEAGSGCYAWQCGLSASDWQSMQIRCARPCRLPSPDTALRLHLMSELNAARRAEQEQLADWLAIYMVEDAAPVHRVIASTSLAFNHLWQDLGLASRAELRELMSTCFPQLVTLNQQNMRWKKFFYRQRCLQNEGEIVCLSPSCDECCEKAICFASD